jgi:hypothetical protein
MKDLNSEIDRLVDRQQKRSKAPGVLATFSVIVAGCVALLAMCDQPVRAEAPPVIDGIVRKSAVKPAETHLILEEPVPWCTEPEHLVPDLMGRLLQAEVSNNERLLIETAMYECSRKPEKIADPWMMLAVLRTEKDIGIPAEARGILLASWCVEGALRTVGRDGGSLRGDYRDGEAMAHGPFQLWPWQRQWCGLTDAGADDPVMAARCHAKRIMDRREARALSCKDSWRVGEALAANGPRYLPAGCAAESAHWRELTRWRAVMDRK